MEYIKLREVISSAKTERCGASDYPVLSITKSDGVVLQSDKFKKRIASTDTEQYKLVKRGQLVQGIHIDEANFGIQSIVDIGIVSPAYKIWNVDFQKIVPKYLETVLRSPRSVRYYSSKFNGSVKRRERIADNDFLAMEIPFPSKEQQQYAVDVLEKASNMTTLYQQQLQKLDELVKARFVELFGDCVLNTKRWNTRRLGDIAEVGSSKRVFVEELRESGIPFFRGTEIGALAEGKSIKPELFISENHYKELCSGTGTPNMGDLLMPSICPDGRIWVVNTTDPFYFKDGRVLWVHKIDRSYNSIFLLYTLKDRIMTDYNSIASGTTFAELKIFALKECRIFDAPLELQEQFAAFVTQADKSKVIEAINKANILFNITLNGGNRYDIRANEF